MARLSSSRSQSHGKYGRTSTPTPASIPSAPSRKRSWSGWRNSPLQLRQPGLFRCDRHFTQAVWKSTTQVAVAVVSCPAGTIFSSAGVYVVTRCSLPGNIQGQFPQRVGRPV
ncbi:CAP domain-containing protein [Nocardia fusca]|uniref:CAP domain-containing protein n=1 Tax=Nocardia fusca TaxID=941183 RepID=UPI0037CCB23E